jgi:hypothetical protein
MRIHWRSPTLLPASGSDIFWGGATIAFTEVHCLGIQEFIAPIEFFSTHSDDTCLRERFIDSIDFFSLTNQVF